MKTCWLVMIALLPSCTYASLPPGVALHPLVHPLAPLCLLVFILAYLAVIAEEKLRLNKSKPVMLAAGIIWVLIAIIGKQSGMSHEALHRMVEHNLSEYAGIFLFLLVAMTYVNMLTERNMFAALKSWLIRKRFTLRQLFWITGLLAFFISPIADNMTTALLMGAVIMAIGEGHHKFIVMAMINIVIAANAGGVFSPFGDITTLMVWQADKVRFFTFFHLFLPALSNFLLPALGMSLFIPKRMPFASENIVRVKQGGWLICLFFLLTIVLAVTFEQVLALPAFMGMMTGFALLMFFVYFLRQVGWKKEETKEDEAFSLDVFKQVALAEWDTLLFFFGVIFSVGGLACLGYLTVASEFMYGNWGATMANGIAGIMSSIIDNIPVMLAILHMNPSMDEFQWLLVTLTTGVGGSLLSVGSAAGVALMGLSKGAYTFMSHLRWSGFIFVGYIASIATHFLVHQRWLFEGG